MARRPSKKTKVSKVEKKRNKPRHNFNIKPKTPNQKRYIESIKNNTVVLCSGPSGSSKTFTATGMAMKLYQEDENVHRILIVRPAIEACGESLGYLPGDLDDKMRPFAEPIFDSLRVFIKDESYIDSLLERKIIQIVPMSHMRGRTWNDCVVIFDEAQNATREQMKLFLTRIGFNCKAIINGDVTQSDIPDGRLEDNGLSYAMKRLEECPDIGIIRLNHKDIVRSPIVAEILKRYD